MQAVLVIARHPHLSAMGLGGVEQAQELGPEPARSGGLPHASDALGSGGVAETQQQRCCVATSGQGLKPSNNAHKVGLHDVVSISPNVGRMAAGSTAFRSLICLFGDPPLISRQDGCRVHGIPLSYLFVR